MKASPGETPLPFSPRSGMWTSGKRARADKTQLVLNQQLLIPMTELMYGGELAARATSPHVPDLCWDTEWYWLQWGSAKTLTEYSKHHQHARLLNLKIYAVRCGVWCPSNKACPFREKKKEYRHHFGVRGTLTHRGFYFIECLHYS